MIDILFIGIDMALAFWVGWAVGRRNRPKSDKPSANICSCSHGYGSHESARKCAAQIKRADKWDDYACPCHWIWVPCPCLTYDGPEPLPRVWTESG